MSAAGRPPRAAERATQPDAGATLPPGLRAQLALDDRSVPPAVADLATRLRPGVDPEPLWRNQLGGLTVALGDAVLKHVPAQIVRDHPREPTPLDEAERIAWVGDRHPVPRVLDAGADDDGQWLLTARIDATTAVAERWRAEPRATVRALGAALRRLHDALPVDGCPWRLPDALLADTPAHDLVVSHGDACAPNTVLDDAGRFAAHVDLGALAVADRHLDLAVGLQSLEWNYGPGWEAEYLASYGLDADPARLARWWAWWNSGGSESRSADSEP